MALDIAFQCSPDHPWVREHPEWFRRRPDGTIQYAENPPKKYQDIYPLDFETPAWRELWNALRDVMLFWIEQGVRILRVDNPHTKPFPFWEWALTDLKARLPRRALSLRGVHSPAGDVPAREARVFPVVYLLHLAEHQGRADRVLHRAHPNRRRGSTSGRISGPTRPDILPEGLQVGGRPAFASRLVLAATLGANYGIYGPAFELGENAPYHHGQRGVSQLGEVRAQAPEPRRRRRACAS